MLIVILWLVVRTKYLVFDPENSWNFLSEDLNKGVRHVNGRLLECPKVTRMKVVARGTHHLIRGLLLLVLPPFPPGKEGWVRGWRLSSITNG